MALGEFLYDDMHNQYLYDYFTSWLQNNNEDQEHIYGNANGLTKINEHILVHSILPGDPEPDENNDYVFITTQENLLIIIDTWVYAFSSKPSPLKVTIIQDGNNTTCFE